MKCMVACMFAVSGLAFAVHAQSSTQLKYEASLDGLNWSSTIAASPGQTVEVRVRAIYSGSTSIGGFAQIIFQPVVGGWLGHGFTANGPAYDNVLVQSQGLITDAIGPIGGSRTTPLGSVPNAPGSYGRISPFAAATTTSTNYYRGFVGTGTAAGLMRISQACVTQWIGTGATYGSNSINNVSGRGGISAGQIAGGTRFWEGSPDVAIFRFAIRLAENPSLRTLEISTPNAPAARGVGARLVSGVPEEPDVLWYLDSQTTATLRTQVTVSGAWITVPAPSAAAITLACIFLHRGPRARRASAFST